MYKTLIIVMSLFTIMAQVPLFAQNSNNSVGQSKTENILNRIFDKKRSNYKRNDNYRIYNNDSQYQNKNKNKNKNKRKKNNKNQKRKKKKIQV